MIICPSCKSDNPGNNRFCEKCGYTLQSWRVFFSPQPAETLSREAEILNSKQQTFFPDSLKELQSSANSNGDTFLDSERRYQLPRDNSGWQNTTTALLVIDHYPEQGSPIANIQADWLQNPDQEASQINSEANIPSAALPYLALQADFFPIVPELHHAWIANHQAILLIEDRSQWPLFKSYWQSSTDVLEKITWLYEITMLWDALSQWQCQSTLLDPGRLRIGQDKILCLEYLITSPVGTKPELADLGLTWQTFIQSDKSASPIEALVNDLATGQIANTTILQAKLAQLADAWKASAQLVSNGNYDLTSPALSPMTDQLPTLVETDSEAEGIGTTSPFSLEDLTEDAEPPDSPTMVLPMKLVQVNEVGRTYVGRQREHNEDYYCAQTNLNKRNTPHGEALQAKGIYILCDGMGGHASGEVASELAVKTLVKYFSRHWGSELPSEEVIRQGVAAANQAIYDQNQANERLGSARMGTTLVMVLLNNTRAAVVHVGDSRLYTYNQRLGFHQVTIDHEVGQREIQRGVEPAIAYARPDAYQLTQALGPRSQKDLKPDISYIDIVEDTLFLLCSDGLSDNDLLEKNCSEYIEPLLRSRADLEEGVTKLVNLANSENGHDNITAILIRIKLKPDMSKLQR